MYNSISTDRVSRIVVVDLTSATTITTTTILCLCQLRVLYLRPPQTSRMSFKCHRPCTLCVKIRSPVQHVHLPSSFKTYFDPMKSFDTILPEQYRVYFNGLLSVTQSPNTVLI